MEHCMWSLNGQRDEAGKAGEQQHGEKKIFKKQRTRGQSQHSWEQLEQKQSLRDSPISVRFWNILMLPNRNYPEENNLP